MQEFDYKDSSFNLEDCATSDLFIHTGADGFSFLVRNANTLAIRQFHLHSFNSSGTHLLIRKIRESVEGNELLQQSFSKTTLLLTDRSFSMIPESVYSDKLTDFLYHNKRKHDEKTVVVPVQHKNAFLTFSVAHDLFDFLTMMFPGAAVSHEIVMLSQNSEALGYPHIHFHFHAGWFYALSCNSAGLEFVNTFEYRNENDLIYFILSLTQTLEMGTLPVILSGRIVKGDNLFNSIRKYIPKAEITEFNSDIQPGMENFPSQYLPGIIPF